MKILALIFMLSMFIFSNSLYYSICLLVLVLTFLSFLLSNYFISSISLLMFCIVYIGAIIILIGYVCAVCPNVLVYSSFRSFIPLSFLSLIFFFVLNLSFPKAICGINFISSFFYGIDGVFIFFSIIFILFVTLLMVTTYYSNPKGPFRSIS